MEKKTTSEALSEGMNTLFNIHFRYTVRCFVLPGIISLPLDPDNSSPFGPTFSRITVPSLFSLNILYCFQKSHEYNHKAIIQVYIYRHSKRVERQVL